MTQSASARHIPPIARRAARVRYTLKSKAHGRPRLSVFRSNRYIYAQIIDDTRGQTLAAASSLEAEMRRAGGGQANRASAAKVGALIANRAQAQGIQAVVFDRGGYQYCGCVQSLAEAARSGGLQF